ncbi:MAG: hypothetical protein LAO51_18215 [Acidobacteriia bacterium]|nr:hypothetical protein [Terriglobia bacterium]
MTPRTPRSLLVRAALLPAALAAAALAHLPAGAVHTRIWSPSAFDLERGDADGVAVTTRGRLFLVPRFASLGGPRLAGTPAHVWSAAADPSGNVILGTGPEGRVIKVTPAGVASVLFTTADTMVTSLAFLPGGDLLAGTAPGGKIYRIGPSGKGSVWCETGERYVWSLAIAPDGTVFAGTGEQGILLKIDRTGKAEPFFDSDEAHLVSLALLPGGGLIAGGAGRGLVYRIDGEGHARILHDDELPEARAVAIAPDGAVYAALLGPPEAEPRAPAVRIQVAGGAEIGASPDHVGDLQERPGPTLEGVIEGLPAAREERGRGVRGKVIRIAPDGTDTEIWRSSIEAPFCLLLDKEGRVLFGAGEPARLYRSEAPDEVALVASFPEGQVTGLLAAGGAVVAATSNPAAAFRMEGEAREAGVYVSRPFDAGTLARWGTIRWLAEGAPGRAEFYTRTGNTGDPDATWSAWSPALTDPAGSKVTNPDGRFVQWRARLAGGDAAGSRVSSASISFAPVNRSPALRELVLEAPKLSVSGKATFRFGVADPDGDPVSVEIRYRKLGDEAFAVAARVESIETATGAGDEDEAAFKDGKAVWDTASVSEGVYEVRAIASDRAANFPDEGKERPSSPPLHVTVDRTPPVIEARRIEGGAVEVKATDALSPVNRLEAMRDGKVVFQARPMDGVSDSREEVYRIAAVDLGSGTGAVQSLRVLDDAGNVAETPVPAP